jgi:hypothetical protein
MSVRVVARIRPLLKPERQQDIIVTTVPSEKDDKQATVRIPNPKNEAELYTFQFHSVYGQQATQQELFEAEGRYSEFDGETGV